MQIQSTAIKSKGKELLTASQRYLSRGGRLRMCVLLMREFPQIQARSNNEKSIKLKLEEIFINYFTILFKNCHEK